MLWIVGHEPEFCPILIYTRYETVIDSLQQDIKSNLELDSKGASALMGLSGPRHELICHVGMIYKGWIDSWFTLMHKDVLVIM